MGGRTFLNSTFIQKFYPYRKILVAASILCIVLAILIIFENILVLASQQYRQSQLIVLSYLLAWLFVMTGLIGLKVSFLAQNYVTVRQMTTHMRPTSATVWSNQLETSAFFAQPPGLVPTTTFPPPPPPYSQINQSPSATSPNPNQRTSPAAVASAPPDYELIIRVDQPNRLNDSVLPH